MNYKYSFTIQVFLLANLISYAFPLLTLVSSSSEYAQVSSPFITQNFYNTEKTSSLSSLALAHADQNNSTKWLVVTCARSLLDDSSIKKKKTTLCGAPIQVEYYDTKDHRLSTPTIKNTLKNQKFFDANSLFLAYKTHELHSHNQFLKMICKGRKCTQKQIRSSTGA